MPYQRGCNRLKKKSAPPVDSQKNSFIWEGTFFHMVKTKHMCHNNHLLPSYVLFIENPAVTIYLSTDAIFDPDKSMKYFDKADIIFHDSEISPTKSGVHAHFDSLSTLPLSIKKKMWCYHYSNDTLPYAKSQGFGRVVKKGQFLILSKMVIHLSG